MTVLDPGETFGSVCPKTNPTADYVSYILFLFACLFYVLEGKGEGVCIDPFSCI